MATIKKILKPADDEAPKKILDASNALSLIMNDKEMKGDIYNDVVAENKLISTGSLLMDSIVKIRSGQVIRLVGKGAELGKAQPLWSNVLTPSGWKKIGDLELGERIMNSEGGISEVIGIFPQGKLKVNAVKFSDDTVVHCCDEHLWLTKNCYKRYNKQVATVKTTAQIKKTLKKGTHNNHSIPYVKPLEFGNENFLDIHPYLMGLLLGDGCFRHKSCLGFTTADSSIIDEIKAILPEESSIRRSCKDKGYDYRINGKVLFDQFKKYDLIGKFSFEKHIPEEYMLSSIENRKELLMGLMDTDGSAEGKGGSVCEFSTTSEVMADQVVFLAKSLGGKVSKASRTTKYTYKEVKKDGRLSYRVIMSFTDFCPFKLKRKAILNKNRKRLLEKYIVGISDAGEEECVCIKTSAPDSLYITDGFNLTHNTSEAFVIAENFMKTMEKSKTIFYKAEGRLSKEMMKRTGLKFVFTVDEWEYGTVFVLCCNIFETVATSFVNVIKAAHANGEHICGILDSLDGLILKGDSVKGFDGNAKVAGVPLLTKLLFRQCALPIAHYDALLLVTGQYAASPKIDPYAPVAPKQGDSSGGSAIQHQSDYVFDFHPRYNGDYILENDEEKPDRIKNKTLGIYCKVTFRKSASDVTGESVSYPIKKGVIGPAIWKNKESLDIMLAYQILTRGGSWFTFTKEIKEEALTLGIEIPEKVQGMKKVFALLEENEQLADFLYQKAKSIVSVE